MEDHGTCVRYDDLFYREPMRKKAMAKPAEEYRQVSTVVTNYAIHHPTVSFRCMQEPDATKKKSGKSAAKEDFNCRTQGGPFTTSKDVIRLLHGDAL